MSKPHSGQLIRSNALTRQGLILMVPLPAADPVSILPCPLCRPVLAHHTAAVRQNAGRSPFPHRALSDIIAAALRLGASTHAKKTGATMIPRRESPRGVGCPQPETDSNVDALPVGRLLS